MVARIHDLEGRATANRYVQVKHTDGQTNRQSTENNTRTHHSFGTDAFRKNANCASARNTKKNSRILDRDAIREERATPRRIWHHDNLDRDIFTRLPYPGKGLLSVSNVTGDVIRLTLSFLMSSSVKKPKPISSTAWRITVLSCDMLLVRHRNR